MFRKNKCYTILIADDTMIRHVRFSKLFPDYQKTRHFGTQHVFTVSAAIEALAHNRYHMVCLDHDFGTFDDGRPICNWLVENKMCCPAKVLIHSQNHVGAKAMKEILSEIPGIEVFVLPYEGANES